MYYHFFQASSWEWNCTSSFSLENSTSPDMCRTRWQPMSLTYFDLEIAKRPCTWSLAVLLVCPIQTTFTKTFSQQHIQNKKIREKKERKQDKQTQYHYILAIHRTLSLALQPWQYGKYLATTWTRSNTV